MSVNSRPSRCPICQDDELLEVARTESASPDELDEILYQCVAYYHEFTWNDADTDESLAARYDPFDAADDQPGTPAAAAGVTRRASDVDPFHTADGDVHPQLLAAIDQRFFEIMHVRDDLVLGGKLHGPADIVEELRRRGGENRE